MKIATLFLFVSFLATFQLHAQKLEITGTAPNQRVYIDCEGLPIYGECPTIIPINYFYGDYIILGPKEYTFPAKRFEVSRANRGYSRDSWSYGHEYCNSLNENGGNWRLPNQRELFLIFTFRPAMEQVADFPSFNMDLYMSGVVSKREGTAPYPTVVVNMFNGNSYAPGNPSDIAAPSQGYSVRCVRDTW
ncbi:MAG: hypothetical protein ACRC3Z_07725 [Phocaeicola sp.]